MSIFRTCKSHELATGASKCPLNREKIIGALVVPHGYKLDYHMIDNGSDGRNFEEACNVGAIMPIKGFVEYAKNGGEVQVSAVGYGPNQATDVSAWTDSFTLMQYNEALNASLLKTMNTTFDVFFYDRNNVVYGMNLEPDEEREYVIEGFPMSCIYPTNTPYPTSGAQATLVVNFCYKDARRAMENAASVQAGFDIDTFAVSLTPVKLIQMGDGQYKIVEGYGGLDRTDEFLELSSDDLKSVFYNVRTIVKYEDQSILEISTADQSTPRLKETSELYAAGLKGMKSVVE